MKIRRNVPADTGQAVAAKLDRRAKRALASFQTRDEIRASHLPKGIGLETMRKLEMGGFVERVAPNAAAHPIKTIWRRTRSK